MSTFRATKSIEALSASFNRALAGARQPQVTAARWAQQKAGATTPGGRPSRQASELERIASRRRTNLLIGTLDRFRSPRVAWGSAQQRGLSSAG